MQPLRRRVTILAGSALLVALAGIGIAQAQPSGSTATSPTGATASDPDLATIDAVLAAEQVASEATGRLGAERLRRLAVWKHLVHATVVVDLPKVGLTTIQLDHGTISAVSATSLTIAEAGGSSVTVGLSDESRVRRDGAKAALADLKTGDVVVVMSKVESGGTTAYLVVVPRD
ncbi:MAG: hypothetical protein M3Q66_06730 [Chloroflexota bacterium]|nr:hypothetical protein [Chloroflexota bacterium]